MADAHPTCNCEEVMLQSTVSELQHCFILPRPPEVGAGQGAPSFTLGQGSSAAFFPKGLLPPPCLLLFRIEKLLTAVSGRVTIWWVSLCVQKLCWEHSLKHINIVCSSH